MQCSKDFNITINAFCVDWSTLSAFTDAPGSPTVVGSGTLSQGHPAAATWTQGATAAAGGIRWQTLIATLTYDGPDCDCNLELITNAYSGGTVSGQVTVFAPLSILIVTTLGVGTTNNPFTLPSSGGVPYTVTIQCVTNAANGDAIDLEFTLSTV